MADINKKGFFSLLGMLLALVIVCALVFVSSRRYFQKSSVSKEEKKALAEQGIDASTYTSTLESTKQKLKGIEQKYLNQEDELWKQVPRQ